MPSVSRRQKKPREIAGQVERQHLIAKAHEQAHLRGGECRPLEGFVSLLKQRSRNLAETQSLGPQFYCELHCRMVPCIG